MGRDEVTASTPSDPERPPLLLLDTHALVWLVFGTSALGAKAHNEIDLAAQDDHLALSAITPWEIGMLARKKKIELYRDPLDWVQAALSLKGIRLIPLGPEIAVGSNQLPFDMHADPADRILVATARHLAATLVTADRALLELAKSGHFRAMDAAT
jgi:PIN domain nuclease of toxin-antitoxin system